MRISVSNDQGTECFSYDTNKNTECLCPGNLDKPLVVEALDEAVAFLAGPPAPLWPLELEQIK